MDGHPVGRLAPSLRWTGSVVERRVALPSCCARPIPRCSPSARCSRRSLPSSCQPLRGRTCSWPITSRTTAVGRCALVRSGAASRVRQEAREEERDGWRASASSRRRFPCRALSLPARAHSLRERCPSPCVPSARGERATIEIRARAIRRRAMRATTARPAVMFVVRDPSHVRRWRSVRHSSRQEAP